MRRTGCLAILILSSALGAAAQAPNTISTVAGGGTNPAPATSAYMPGAYGIVRDAVTGNTYVSLQYLAIVYKVDSSGNITPYAGKGISGFSGDGSAATSAQLNSPSGLAVDSSGNLFIADANNNRIRRVDVNSRVITTVAGSGNQYNGIGFFGGFSGDGSPATGALMNSPRGVAVDQSGNLFIADTNNNRIRMVDNSPGHIITTYAGAGGGCGGQTDTIGDGCPAIEGTLAGPLSVAVHLSGDLYIADSSENLVRKVDNSANHIITSYAGGGAGCPGQTDSVGDGCPAIQAALRVPSGVSVDTSENVFISDTKHERIRKVDTTTNHIITSVAGNGSLCTSLTVAPANCGNGGAASSALLNRPREVFVDGLENILYADLGTNRFRLISAGTTPTISNYAGGGTGGDGGLATAAVMGIPFVVTADGAGDLFLVENGGYRIRKVNATTQDITSYVGNGIAGAPGAANGDGGPATQANITNIAVYGMALDSSGNLYFTDANNWVVRRVDAQTGLVTLVAGTYGQQCTSGNCGDGGPATSATFIFPDGVAVDSSGNVYIADAANNRIRVVTMNGAIPGNIANFAGTGQAGPPTNGVALSATLNFPGGMAFDANGNLFFADSGNNVIRKIDTGGNISTVAFNGIPTFGGDGGPALSASMFSPTQVAFDATGNLFVGGGFDNVVRRIDAQAQSVITVAGDIDNLDGGFNGDGGLAPQSLLSNFGVAVVTNATTHVNTLYIADPGNNRTRKVVLVPTALVNSSLLKPFGPVLAGASSSPGDVTITNNGLDDLIVSNVSAPAGFTLANDCQIPGAPPTPVAPGGAECLLSVVFTPPAGTAGGTAFSGNLTFNTNDSANPSFTFPLSGSVPSQPAVLLTVTLAGTGTGTVTGSVPGLGVTSGTPTLLVCPTPACAVDYAVGQQVTLVALGNAGSALAGWTVNGSSATCPGVTPTCTVTMSAAQNVTANFGPSSITVSAMGNGSGTITITPGGPTCTVTNGAITGGPCTADFGTNAQLTIAAAATGTSSFSGWLGFCSLTGINASGTGPCTVQSSFSGITAVNGSVVTAVFSGPAQTFGQGDVFVGTVDGMIFEYKPSGTLVQVLNSGNLGGVIAGMNFDASGNLYAANPDTTAVTGGTVEFFGNNGTGPTTFGTAPYNSNPLGVLVAPTGNIFVSQSSGQNSLLRMTSAGAVTATFFPAYDNGGIGYIELLDDGGRVLYTSETAGSAQLGTVKNFDIANNNQNPDFATNLPGGPAFAIRELSDKSVLVANSTQIVHLDPNGKILSTPSLTPPGTGLFFALNLDPDGQSFWAGDAVSGKVYRIQISSGAVLATINTGLGFNSSALSFSTIFGIAVFGQPQSGGADVAVTMTAAPNPVAQNSNLTYTITVTNNGPLSASNVTATDVLPAGVTFVSSATSQGSCSGTTTVTCNLGTINSGASPQGVTIVGTAATAGSVTNTVNVTSTTADPNVTNNSATTSTTVTSSGNTFTLTVGEAGTGSGTIMGPGGISCPSACSASFASGTQITLTASPGANSSFGTWSGAPTSCTVTAGACTFNMPAAAETVTGTFNSGTGSNPVLAITKTHSGNFTQGQSGATYTVTVSDGAGAGPTNGTVTVTDTIPTGLTLTSMAGTGWTCTANSCTRSDVLAAGASYPAITVTVSVASNAPASVVNAVSASGGGSATANATDTTTITSSTGTGNGVATVTPSSFAFGGVQLGASVTQTFSLSNTGTGALGNIVISISSVASFGTLDYAIMSNTCPASLAVNSAPCTFTVSFTPSIEAPDPGSVVITDDAAVGPTTVLLSGTGVASVYVLPFEIFYDGQTPGTTSPAQTATLFNVSGSPVGVNGITLVGNAASDFSLVNNQCVNSLSSGSNCTMGVTFKPSTTALGPRTEDLTIATNATGGPFVSHLTGNGAIRHLPGFTANVLPPNDDQSTNEISLPFTLNFFGTNFSSLFVNNNGNVTFGQALSDFTPTGLTGNNGLIPIIAPYWADVDTTGAIPGIANPPSGVVTFGIDIVNGHQAFGVDYENVGYFPSHTDKLNSFQVILIDRSDTGVAGAFDIEFNYDKIQWEAGDASQGTAGLCTVASECAAVGYSNGTGTAGTNFQLNGSFAIGALLDNGPAATSLIHNSLNSTMLGRYEFQVRNGVVEPTLTVTEAGAGTGTVVSSPAGINCPGTCSTSFVSGAQITLTATAGANSTFTGWSGGTCEGTSPCTFTITASASVTANFGTGTGNNFALTVTDAGTGTGTVMSAPAGINCPTTCSANFASGQVVTLTATASEGSTFTGWSGAGCTGTGTCVVTVTAATAVTATFNSGNSPVIISVGPGSSSTVNTVPGGSGVFGLVLTGQTGFTGTVQLTCTSPIASITCNIVPSSVTLNGTTTNVAIVVNTFCKGFIPNLGPTPGGFGTGTGLLLMALTLCGAAWRFKKQPRWAVSFGLLVIFGVGMTACSNLAKSPSGTATPPGSYPLVVTATPPSGAPSHVNLTLVVK